MAKLETAEITKQRLSIESWQHIKQLYAYIKPYRLKFLLGLLCLFASSIISLLFPFVAGRLIDAASANKSSSFHDDINLIAGLLVLILIIQSFFSFFRIILFSEVSERGLADLRADLYGHLIRQPMSFFANKRVGELNSRISSDISLIQDTFTIALAEFLRGIMSLLVGIIVIAWLSPWLTVVMLSVFPLLIVIAIIFGRYIRKLSKKTQDQLAETNIIVDETLQGIQTVKTFTNEAYEYGRYRIAIDKVVRVALKGARSRGAFASFIIFGLFGAIVLVLWQGARQVSMGQMTIGELTSFIIYTTFVGAALGGFSEQYAQLQKTIGATERIREILQEPTETIDMKLSPPVVMANDEFLSNATVEFKQVHFSYPGREGVEVLSGVNFSVSSGEKIAIVGGSGGGKTTLISLICQLYQPTKGVIEFDGKPASQYSIYDLRSIMALVPQEVLLFGGTIRENILYGNLKASQEQLEFAAKEAFAHDFILSFPDKYDTVVGERGIKLSGGQRQRIAIARAILKNPKILILDEATSALDSQSEHVVQAALDNLMKGRTTFIIAHRLSSVRNANRILVLQNGQIVQEGTHEELMSDPTGVYLKLANLQYLGYGDEGANELQNR
jgi:ATP-binding cassette subfamily B protein